MPRRAVRLPGPGVFELTLVATPLISLALAGLVGGTALGLAPTASARRWFVILCTAIAVVHLVGAASFAHSGPFSPAAAGLPALARGLVVRLGTRPPFT